MIRKSVDEHKINAFMSKNTTFKGTLLFDGLMKLDGIFEGNIKTEDTLVIADTSNVKADIEAGIVKISGNFEGNIVAKSKVELFKPANVKGIIKSPAISMEEGVVFNGTCDMNKTPNNKLKEVKQDEKTINRR